MGYDVEFVQLTMPAGTKFPVEPESAARLVKKAAPFADVQVVRAALLKLEGCRPGPKDAVDYLGRGMSYARIFPRHAAIYVENNCNAADLIRILVHLQKDFPSLLILDMQSKQLHTAESYKAWWGKPL
ncbi:MAG TPA: hypothetical protein PLL20_08880 [Phycisphaerae bacterium]|nr:hypothetical protein [Phycisphaerae bacterium]HRR84095.1 hypothetical protein [Phycisphaerae bacterium]